MTSPFFSRASAPFCQRIGASIRQMSGQVSRGSVAEYQADERAEVARLRWRVSVIVTVPIFLSDSVYDTRIEIQIRTVAMDFWASLEHKMNYKFESNVPEHIKQELYDCAKMVSDLDDRMLKLNEEILKYAQENP